jgi:general stress protein 26
MQKNLASIAKLIDHCSASIISSVDSDGFPNTKAMLPPRKRNGLREFYFTTNTSSRRVAQYRVNPKACLYFFDGRQFQGVQLIGTMEVLEDSASKQMIWRAGDEMYYPGGVDDADYCVLKFTAHSGRRYGNFHSEDFRVED